MVFFCQHCFKEIPQDATLCPFCGAYIKSYDARSFEDKLIHALKHPLPETVSISIIVLGKIRSTKAIKPLKKLFSTTSDPYMQKEILDALFAIGGKDAEEFLKKMLSHENVIVRKEAEMLVKKMV